jgi:esterase/lipase superfamily enzyme
VGDVSIFVHGYNTNYQEALFRLAQMVGDAKPTGVPILFSWPSQGELTGYGADREAVTYSRDNLTSLLMEIKQRRPARTTIVFAHSLGSWLVMEGLRQLRLQGRSDVLDRLKVILAAPDIDEDVFAAQLSVIGQMRLPITLLVSSDDRALALSSRLAGDHRRIGSLDASDPAVIAAARTKNVQVIDVSAMPDSDGFGHDRFVAMASTLPRAASAREGPASPLGRAGAFVLDAASAAITSPLRAIAAR